jgi:hypothetical protein
MRLGLGLTRHRGRPTLAILLGGTALPILYALWLDTGSWDDTKTWSDRP